MKKTLTEARAHDALDAALDRLVQGLPVVAPQGLESLIQTARAAREALSVQIPDDVSRAHLAALDGVPTLERARPRHRVALVLLAAVVAVVLLGGAAVAASGSALPGGLLYPVKRATERIELLLSGDPASRARLHLEFAQRRLTELSDLLAARRAGQSVDIGAAMSAYQGELGKAQAAIAADASDPAYQALLASVEGQLQGHLAVLSALRDNTVAGPAQTAIENAIDRAKTAQSAVSEAVSKAPTGNGKPSVEPSNSPSRRPSGLPNQGTSHKP